MWVPAEGIGHLVFSPRLCLITNQIAANNPSIGHDEHLAWIENLDALMNHDHYKVQIPYELNRGASI